MDLLLAAIPLAPLVGFLLLGLLRWRSEALIGTVGSGSVGLAFLSSLGILGWLLQQPATERSVTATLYSWIVTGNLRVDIAFQADPLSIVFALVVTGVGFLIHVYSIGYMHNDPGFRRFFAYLNLFIFMMLVLVLSDNLLLTFVGWEGVGLCSYLLIGFWYDRRFEGVGIIWTTDAGRKAFIMNRIGDVGMLLAMFLLVKQFGTLEYDAINAQAAATLPVGTEVVTAITLLLFLACTGKSAQIPLATWLPDAMAGPTPVSALIHAATMVTAGVFLVVRLAPLFALAPATMTVVAFIGVLTAFTAATIGLVQTDIKKVLAYSTVSQLGFMFTAAGVGAFAAAVFHVVTHAFFKALLFLGAGAVIHALHEQQNIHRMGGLARHMPTTYRTFLIAGLAIAGIPPLSGFFSKDAILWHTFERLGAIGWVILVAAAFCTAFYTFRLIALVFRGQERFDRHLHPHEAPAAMRIPLVILAVLSAIGGFIGIPYALLPIGINPNLLETWLEPLLAPAAALIGKVPILAIHWEEYLLMLVATAVSLAGIWIAWRRFTTEDVAADRWLERLLGPAFQLLRNKYYVDEAYQKAVTEPVQQLSERFLWRFMDVAVIDGAINGIAAAIGRAGEILRRLQTGIAQSYAMLMLVGILALLSWLVFF
ncbi:MAG: NADH-quinone oxidoreductase subunit L [Candidatus Kapabacteria bacterium]|nr:NADH-quinone oxidoreductase subunit L [Candidatus Kapabacteria bacterium]MDW8011613.1 NADH-quinone oxidoreductase subunit L [Bacteroidota bacterium]